MALSKKKKKHLKLTKRHPILGIFFFIVVSVMLGIFLVLYAFGFMMFYVDDRISNEYNNVKILADICVRNSSEGNTDLSVFDMSDREYVILDQNGNVVTGNTRVTFDPQAHGTYTGVFIDKQVDIYPDNSNYLVRKTYYGNTVIRVSDIVNIVLNPSDYTNLDMTDEDSGTGDYVDSSVISIYDDDGEEVVTIQKNVDTYVPFWIGIPLEDGNTLVCKCYYAIKNMDSNMALVASGILVLVMFFIGLSVLVVIIRSIKDHRKMTKLLFLDYISNNHNWLWFKTKGEEILRANRNATKRYAVVCLIFVGYRNYVLCHSVEEGEDLLIKIYNAISGSLIKRKELAAHSASDAFPLLMQYNDRESFESRLQALIEKLENIDSDHRFDFQAGVRIVDIIRGKTGLVLRRKNIDLDLEFNNAFAAQLSISDNKDVDFKFFDNSIVENEKWHDLIIEKRAQAIEQEDFLVYYQPKYNPRTDELSGAEALIRWDFKGHGLIPPGRFIPIFEKDGFITEIDHFMLTHVARDQRRWLDAGLKCVPVSVNVSRAHFSERDLADQIRDAVDMEGAPHHLIEIELTESAFFDDQDMMIDTIKKLKSYGFIVSMDDFGSGYSSLNSLKDMPLDVLKLDAGFFRDVSDNGRSEIVVSQAIHLAKSLNMKTVAEGVEERDTVEFLAAEGCDMIQGYVYSKPLPSSEYQQRLTGDYSAAEDTTPVKEDMDELDEYLYGDDDENYNEYHTGVEGENSGASAEEASEAAVPQIEPAPVVPIENGSVAATADEPAEAETVEDVPAEDKVEPVSSESSAVEPVETAESETSDAGAAPATSAPEEAAPVTESEPAPSEGSDPAEE